MFCEWKHLNIVYIMLYDIYYVWLYMILIIPKSPCIDIWCMMYVRQPFPMKLEHKFLRKTSRNLIQRKRFWFWVKGASHCQNSNEHHFNHELINYIGDLTSCLAIKSEMKNPTACVSIRVPPKNVDHKSLNTEKKRRKIKHSSFEFNYNS